MNTPNSKIGNLTRYFIYLIIYFIYLFFQSQAIEHGTNHLFWTIGLIVIFGLSCYFYLRQFVLEERRFFKREYDSWSVHIKLIVIATAIIALIRLYVSFQQYSGHLALTSPQSFYLANATTTLFWSSIVFKGILMSILQGFIVNGFFFNYFFKRNTLIDTLLGLVMSGLIFSILNFSQSFVLFTLHWLIGMVISFVYLRTYRVSISVYLLAVNAIMTIILF
ncbi:CPBP family glutamic-type intramembrane protease [Holzapfeliella sp. JNUCC 72]